MRLTFFVQERERDGGIERETERERGVSSSMMIMVSLNLYVSVNNFSVMSRRVFLG